MAYGIVEEPSFKEAVGRLGGAYRIDAAMEALVEPLSRKPHEVQRHSPALSL